jgi:D-alanyl-D-alanine carboxypeptidase
MVVYTGPKKTGAALIAAVATDTEKQGTPRRGKKSRVAAKKPDTATPKAEAKSDAKPAAKPVVVVVRHASAKPDAAAKPAEKPAASAAKPAKPKAAAKPKSETKPAG